MLEKEQDNSKNSRKNADLLNQINAESTQLKSEEDYDNYLSFPKINSHLK